MRKFHSIQLWFLIPGTILLVTSIYVPISYLNKSIFWTETEALIIERVEENTRSGVELVYYMEFSDHQGRVHKIKPNTDDTFIEGKDANHVLIFYEPTHPANFELVNPGRYMLILFLPFAMLLLYLGWPEKIPDGTDILRPTRNSRH